VRSLLGGVAIHINSSYRGPALNAAIGGSKTSAHMKGLAADFIAPSFGSVLEIAQAIAASGIVFDQLIHEYGTWVHIGLAATGKTPRQQKLSIFKGTGYLTGIRSKP
jgi:zinc D-Ala-D-Ala carboxypeptidase